MMVDSSVVVLENIYRRRQENGETPRTAAVAGTREVSAAVVAGTVTTLVIFLPLVFVRGVPGVLFKELAYVIMFAVLRLLVALSLVPMLASRLLSAGGRECLARLAGRALGTRAGVALTALENGYRDLLRGTFAPPLITVLVSVAIFAASLLLVPYIGTEFLPPSDEGEVRVTGEMDVGTPRPDRPADPADGTDRLRGRARVGVRGRHRRHLWHARQRQGAGRDPPVADPGQCSGRAPMRTLRASCATASTARSPGMTIRTRAPQGQFLLERLLASEEGVTVEVRGFDLDTLAILARRVADGIADVPGVTDVSVSREAGVPQQQILVLRDKIADLGLEVRDDRGHRDRGRRFEGRRVPRRRQLLPHPGAAGERREALDRRDPRLTLRTLAGEQVALRNLVTTEAGRVR